MTRNIEERFFEDVPIIADIMCTRMEEEHKQITAEMVHNFQEDVIRGEFDAVDLDFRMNELKMWIYSFAVKANYSDQQAKRIARIPAAYNISTNLAEMLLARAAP